LAKGVWLIPGGFLPKRQPDGNTVVLEGAAGLVVLDTGRHRWQRQAILDFARARNAPIVAIVNSHWHLDHVSGNPDLKAAYPGVKFYASDAIDGALAGFLKDSAKGAREYLQSPDLPPETAEDIRADLATIEKGDALKPDVLVTKSGTMTLGGRKIQMNLALDGPTAGDVWIYDSASRIAAVGDLVTLPVPFLDTACVAGWKSALAQVWATSFEMLVPGHGKPMTRAEFSQYRAAFGGFIDCSNSSRDKADCAAGWTKDAGSLIEANGMDSKRAEALAAYYIGAVLRPNGGNSKYCRTQG
jgi:glyoxylase-like metal-dependent hydrolase (beta-lactamase superfamily II)